MFQLKYIPEVMSPDGLSNDLDILGPLSTTFESFLVKMNSVEFNRNLLNLIKYKSINLDPSKCSLYYVI